MNERSRGISDDSPTLGGGFLRANVVPAVVASGLTAAVHLAVFAAAASAMSPLGATVATILLSGLWVAVAAPVFAASGRTPLAGLIRGGGVIDGSIVVLVVLAARGRGLGWGGAVRIYLILAAVALTQCALVSMGRRIRTRQVLAAASVLAVLAISAGPFWANGAISAAEAPGRDRVASVVVAANPVFALGGCLKRGSFLWQERPILYEFTVLGRDVPMPSTAWYATLAAYGLLAGGLAAAARARRSRP